MSSHHSHPTHSHYPPHRPVPTQPVVGLAPPPTTTTTNPSNLRLPELLECVKQEYESLQNEVQSLKTQTQEFETHISAYSADVRLLRDQLFHLDNEHAKLKTHYEEELRRLHHQLEQRSTTGAGQPQSINHDLCPPPNLPQSSSGVGSLNSFGVIVNSNQPNSVPSNLHNGQNSSSNQSPSIIHHDSTSFSRERDSAYTNGSTQRNSSDNPINDHQSKRLRSDRDRPDSEIDPRNNSSAPPSGQPAINHNPTSGLASPPVLPNPAGRAPDQKNKIKPNDTQYSKLSSSNPPHSYVNSYHPRGESHISAPSHHLSGPPALPSAGSGPPVLASSATPAPPQTPGTNTNVLLDLDPDSLPNHMKKEGADWMTMFNPKVKKVLDVGLVHTLVHDSVVCCVKFSPDGSILATGCNRYTSLYNTRTGQKICQLLDDNHGNKAADNYIRSASFSPDGKLLATGSEDRVIRIWEVAQKRILNRFQGHKSEIYSLAFSPDGRMLVSGSGDKTARIWDMNLGTCLFHLMIEETIGSDGVPIDAGVTSVCVSPDGSILAAGSLDTVVRLWDSSNGQLLDKLKGHKDSVYSVAFSPDGKFLVSGSLDRTLKLWDLSTLNREGNPPGGAVVKNEEGENGEKVTSDRGFDSSRPSTVCTTTLTGHKDYVLSVAVSPDGEWIMSGSKDRGVQFWDPKTGMAQFMLQGHKNSVISIAVSDTGGLLATGS
ncbi:hypothetical protein O181_075855, partial [Austropuccinia psidii MF-1]|nr:hypothetical protein [Austropuccinia psidii MF-1]